ncbi:MAG: zinc-binding dehydrogenase [Gaiella sp.]
MPDPICGPSEVLVELRAAGLNRRDLLVAGGTYPFPLPLIPGSDGAGVRRDTGEEVVVYPLAGWGPDEGAPLAGSQFLGGPLPGTYAELIAVPEDLLFPRPAGWSWQETATLSVAGITAFRALFTRGGLRAGETVLVLGAGSGVTAFAVQQAAAAGARVLVTSSSDEKIERARGLGAAGGVNYATTPDWPAAVREMGPVHLVLDSVGSTWQQSLECLAPAGRLVVFGGTGGTEVTLQVRPVYFGQHTIMGILLGSPRDFAALLRDVAKADWRPVIDSTYALADAEAALAHLRGDHFGKIVLTCG